jgi:O-antigen ligase
VQLDTLTIYNDIAIIKKNKAMNTTQSEKKYSNIVITLLLLFPVLINSVKIFGNLILLIFAVLGIYIAITEKQNPFKIKELKIFSWLTTGYFLVILFSILYADSLNAEFYHMGRKIHFLLAPWIALTILQIDVPLKKILLSIKIGLIVIGIISIAHLLGLVSKVSMINTNIFGDIAVAMLFLSIVQVFRETPRERIITFIAILLGMAAILLSSSRGSWLSFIILSIVYIGLIYKPFLQGNNKNKLALLLFFTIIFGFIGTQTNVEKRIKIAATEVQEFRSGSNLNDSNGLRLQMWKAGLNAAIESPWVGYGYRNANKVVSEYAPNNKKTIKNKTHLHNEYITHLVSAGILGLLALLTLLLAPVLIFYRKLRDKKTYYYASMGILLCTGYATFGFTHIAFGEEHINAFYVLFMGFLLPGVLRKEKYI